MLLAAAFSTGAETGGGHYECLVTGDVSHADECKYGRAYGEDARNGEQRVLSQFGCPLEEIYGQDNRMMVLRLHRRICRMRFLYKNITVTLRTVQTIWNMVVRVNPLAMATATNGMVVAESPTKRTIGVKNMDISSPAAMVKNNVCILCIILYLFVRRQKYAK